MAGGATGAGAGAGAGDDGGAGVPAADRRDISAATSAAVLPAMSERSAAGTGAPTKTCRPTEGTSPLPESLLTKSRYGPAGATADVGGPTTVTDVASRATIGNSTVRWSASIRWRQSGVAHDHHGLHAPQDRSTATRTRCA